MTRPPRLREGSRLAVYSPSFPGPARHPRRTARGVAALERLGFQIDVPADATRDEGYTAGSPELRAAALTALFADPRVDGIVCSIGGFNSNDIVALLDYDVIAAHPKVIVGYSDATAILMALHAKTGLVTLHGPALLPEWAEFPAPMPYTRDSFLAIAGSARAPHRYQPPGAWTHEFLSWDTPAELRPRATAAHGGWTCIRAGRARGRLIGGNLETVNGLVGSPYCPSFDDALLFVEATAEEASLPRIDRALRHLELAGLTRRLNGLLVARCPDARPEDGVTLSMVAQRFGDRHGIPVAGDLDFGHTDPKMTLPLGVEAEFLCGPDGVSLMLLESAVREA